ncbi:uncharacterized protein Bfra_007464 [Botrytis fragariae]|uniref:Uncharacterized protein n=1 Tax=Botrytis fragariae TaxID=1964551 RepID=A0A8H6AIJ2_9HELO|nr:uncharacterized protein Bfra_007464 [Botrytis fragariae]KAF5868267.1 hypothetical protein Bfra_007464 [Botrytis fragariae]
MSCCPLNACYLAVAVLSAVQCPLLKTVGSPLLDGLAGGVCALLGGSGAVTNACNCLTAANAPGACGSRCTDSQGIGPGYALYTPLSSILGSVVKLAGESVCPGTTGYYCPTGQTCKTRTGSAPYCCNDSTDCYSSLGKCADTSWQQYRVTIGASTSNFCCGNGTIGVYQSTGQNSVGICATARPAFYTTVSAISSGSCSYSTSSIVLSITLSSSISTRSGSSSSQTSTLVPDSPITFTRSRSTSTSTPTSIRASSSSSSTTQSASTSTSISTSPRPSSTLVPDSLITFTRSKSTSTSVSILLSPTSSSTTQSLTSPISSVSSSTSISKSTSTTQIIQSPTFSSSTISSSTSSIVISISTSVSDNLSSTSLTFTATSPSSSAFNQSPPSVSQSNTSIPSSSSSISSLEISQSQSQSQSSSIHFTSSPSQSSSSVSNFISSSFIGPVTAQSSTLSEAESTNSTSTSAPVETPAEPCDASLCLFSRVIPTSREL